MAFLKKPLKWTALGQEPSELKKSEGFKMDESPAPGHFDFMFRSTYEAIEELQQKAGEVKTVNNIQPDSNGNVLITLPDTSKLYQKPTSGIPKTDLDATVQASLKKADDAAPLTELAKTNQALTTHQAEYEQHKSNNVSHDTYVSCATTGATAEKVVTSVGFTLVEGARITVKFTNANTTTTPTLKINTELAKPLVKADGTAFKNIKAGVYSFVYSGSNFTVQGEGGEYGTATANDVVAGKTFGTENGLQTGSATVASLGGIISSDIALFSAIANENSYAVSEIDKNSGRIAYGRYSTIPPIGCLGDLNGNMISQKSVYTPSYVRLVGWYIDYYVTYLPSSGVITFYNHDDAIIFSFNYIANKGIYGICLYQDTVVIVEYDRTTTTLLTIYKNKTGDTISSFSKIISSDNFYFGDNLKLNLYKIPLIYQYTGFSSSMPHFTTGLIKLNGINTIIHKRFYYDFTEPSLRFLKDYITK